MKPEYKDFLLKCRELDNDNINQSMGRTKAKLVCMQNGKSSPNIPCTNKQNYPDTSAKLQGFAKHII